MGQNIDTGSTLVGPGRVAAGEPATSRRARALAAAPVAVVVVVAARLGLEGGGFRLGDWAGEAVVVALLAATVIAAGGARRPPRAAVVCASALFALAAWAAASASWAPSPALARDEALLIALYALVVLLAAATTGWRGGRTCAAAVAVTVLGVATAIGVLRLRLADPPEALFIFGRLSAPVTYSNAQAAFALVAFWPAVVLAAQRATPLWARAGAAGAATLFAGTWLLTQSKGALVALVVSAAVVVAVTPGRLRVLALGAIVVGAVATISDRLLEPFRVRDTAAFAGAVDHAVDSLLIAAAAAAAAAALLALLDRRVTLSPGAHRAVVVAACAVLALVALGVTAAAAARVGDPGAFAAARWDEFKVEPETPSRSTHLLALGSNRYDFWRVALTTFRDDPVAGVGARGFGAVYLLERRSGESPDRAHSVVMDLLAELGLVGIALFGVAAVGFAAGALRRARRSPAAAALVGGVLVFGVHSGGDWIWTFPAVGVVAAALAGSALGRPDATPLRPRTGAAFGIAAGALALLAFAPPWLSAVITDRVARGTAATTALDGARMLDPLSTDPYVVESARAPSAAAAVPPLERAVREEPESARLRYLLGVAELAAGRRAEARTTLRAARALSPGDPAIEAALERAAQP